jgi:hypothetical protein
MSPTAVPQQPPRLTTIHILLGIQTLAVMFGTVNRLGPWTLGYVAPNEFLRWVDFLNMLPIAMLSVAASGALFYVLAYNNGRHYGRWHKVLGMSFLLSVYLFGANYGNHEVTNYLNSRFCIANPLPGGEALCRIIVYNDDEFSHYVFFTAFVGINTVLMLMQVLFPSVSSRVALAPGTARPGGDAVLSNWDVALLLFNGFFIALGVMANLAFEEIGLDLYVIVLLALVSAGLLWRFGRQPLLIYYNVAYWVGLALTVVVRLLRG